MADDPPESGADSSNSRELGVDFGALQDALDSLAYPVTRTMLLTECGDQEVETAGGSQTVQSILGDEAVASADDGTREYDSPEAGTRSGPSETGARRRRGD